MILVTHFACCHQYKGYWRSCPLGWSYFTVMPGLNLRAGGAHAPEFTLVPWPLCGAYMAGTLGVSTMSYLPFAMFCWLCPVLAIVYGFTGKFFWKTGEKSSQKVYQFSTLMEAS